MANLKRVKGLALILNDHIPMLSDKARRLQEASMMTEEAAKIYNELEVENQVNSKIVKYGLALCHLQQALLLRSEYLTGSVQDRKEKLKKSLDAFR